MLVDHKVFVHGTVCTPFALLRALVKHGEHAGLKNVQLFHLHLEGDAEWTKPEYQGKNAFVFFFVLFSSLSFQQRVIILLLILYWLFIVF